MSSVFSTLESARKALAASQEGMEVTSQNISNMSTDGYTRQRIVQQSVVPDLGGSKFLSPAPAVGGGVEVVSVEQVRNDFLDYRYRTENSAKGYNDNLSSMLSQLEGIVNEFSSTKDTASGLSGQISTLITDMKKLQASPNDTNLASTVQTAMDTVCQTVKSDANRLNTLEGQVEGDLSDSIGSGQGNGVNALLQSISSLNRQISNYEVGGQKANDLRDQRNQLLDELSGYADIKVTEQADGKDTISFTNDAGNPPKMLIDANNNVTEIKVGADKISIQWSDTGDAIPSPGGSLEADVEMLTGNGGGGLIGIPETRAKLDAFAKSFTTAINAIAQGGGAASPKDLLSCVGDSSTLQLSSDWVSDGSLIIKNYSGTDTGNYVSQFIDLFQKPNVISYNSSNYPGTIQDFTDSISLDVGKRFSYIKQMASSSDSVVTNLTNERSQTSGVSLDEEGVNIIKYMQSYSAAAKIITTVNEMIQSLLNAVQ